MDIEKLVNYLKSQESKIESLEHENMELRYENATLRDEVKLLERRVS